MSSARTRFGSGKINVDVEVGQHRLVSDASVPEGGDALGPSPHDYLAIALAACTGITLRMYARRKNWPLVDVETEVQLSHEHDTTKMIRTIELVGALDEEQRTRLREIADHCPIHKALNGKFIIDTVLVE